MLNLRRFSPYIAQSPPNMPHQYKLTYFNARGRAEPSRLILAYAGAKYTDNRIEGQEWPALKQKVPFGSLPLLEIDGKHVLCQSKSIARYLGKEFDLMPKCPIQAARGDMLVDGYADLEGRVMGAGQEKDPAKKAEVMQKVIVEHVVPFLALYEKFLIQNGATYFLTNSITWVDLVLYDGLSGAKHLSPPSFGKHPKLNEFVDRVGNDPKVRAWVEKRPKTEF